MPPVPARLAPRAVLPHHHIGHDPSVHGLELDDADTTTSRGADPSGSGDVPPSPDAPLRGPEHDRATAARRTRTSSSSRRCSRGPRRSAVGRRGAPGHDRRAVDHAGDRSRTNPAYIDPSPRLPGRSRSRTSTGGRGAGGTAHGGRKGAPNRRLRAGRAGRARRHRRVRGSIRHIWMTFPPAPPERHAVALDLEVFYDGADRAEHLGAVSRLLRPAARPPGRVPLGVDGGAGRAAASTATCPMPFGRARARRGRQRRPRRIDPLLPDRLHAAARAAAGARVPARGVPAREPDRACAATS